MGVTRRFTVVALYSVEVKALVLKTSTSYD